MNLKLFWRRNRSFLAAVSMLLVVRGTFADQNRVPSGSMEPTILVGDHIFVNRAAYDLKIPFSEVTLAPDNRDNSFDSRGWGFIPRSKIVGKAEGVLFNVNWMQIRPERFGLKFS